GTAASTRNRRRNSQRLGHRLRCLAVDATCAVSVARLCPKATPARVSGCSFRALPSVALARGIAPRAHHNPLGSPDPHISDSCLGGLRSLSERLTKPFMASADVLIAAFRKHNEGAVDLAEAVSFAVRVEPFLLRRVQLELLPKLDA